MLMDLLGYFSFKFGIKLVKSEILLNCPVGVDYSQVQSSILLTFEVSEIIDFFRDI